MNLSQSIEWQKAQRGELYRAFVPELIAARDKCYTSCNNFNDNKDLSRRRITELWRTLTGDERPLPPLKSIAAEDDVQFHGEPIVVPPLHADYGINIKLGQGVFINANTTFIDTCLITIGARTLVGPNCTFTSGTHPLDPALRNGLLGPEMGKAIVIGEDCWLGCNVIVLPGVTIGRGATVGAGSVITKDVPAFHVVAGNPARVLRKIETVMDPTQGTNDMPVNTAMIGDAVKSSQES